MTCYCDIKLAQLEVFYEILMVKHDLQTSLYSFGTRALASFEDTEVSMCAYNLFYADISRHTAQNKANKPLNHHSPLKK